MAKTVKPTKSQTVAHKGTRPVKKDNAELSEDDLKKISGGPTAVEMPGRVSN